MNNHVKSEMLSNRHTDGQTHTHRDTQTKYVTLAVHVHRGLMSYVVVIFLPVWAEGDCIGVRLHSCNAVIEFVLSYSYLLVSFTSYIYHIILMLLVHHLLLL